MNHDKILFALQKSSIWGGSVVMVMSPLLAKITTGIGRPPGKCTFLVKSESHLKEKIIVVT